ncbi:MAG TPA: diacylglycerol kinase family protein [Patescibacteria group bacterium]|nr:diacylglycerol kinase family protein [Patescibacteria group bacterium]
MIVLKDFFRSLRYALAGFKFVWRENNFRLQTIIALIVICLMFIFHLSRLEKVALLIVIVAVLVLESLNTIFEHLSDILKPRLHDYIKIIKDIMAATVLITSLGAVIVGLIIFWPYIFK